MKLEDLKEEFLFDCQSRNLSPLTINNYRKQLNHFITFLSEKFSLEDIEEVRPFHIKAFIKNYLDRQCKASYVNDNLKAVKVFYKYAYSQRYVDFLITDEIKNVKEPKELIHTFSTEEIARMIGHFKKNNYLELRNKLILMVLFDTGIRVSELINMTEEQIKDNYFIIYGKGRKERVVPKNLMVSKYLAKYLEARRLYFVARQAEDYVFLSKNGKRLTEEAIRKMMVEVAKEVGVNPKVRVSPHTCRHSFAHLQLKNGLDLYSLSRLLGHESVKITQIYLEGITDADILQTAQKTSVLGNIGKLNR